MAFGITTFSEAPFAAEGALKTNVAVTGISLASSIGAIQSVTGDANISVTGVQLTGSLGNSTIDLNTIVGVTGSQLTMTLGEETPLANATVSVTGSQLGLSLGTYSISADGNVSIVVTEHDMVTSIGALQSVTGLSLIHI